MIEKKKRSLDRFRLDGLRALVSGAGRGLGHACALALAEAGAEIIALSRTLDEFCLLYTSPSPRDRTRSRMPSSA